MVARIWRCARNCFIGQHPAYCAFFLLPASPDPAVGELRGEYGNGGLGGCLGVVDNLIEAADEDGMDGIGVESHQPNPMLAFFGVEEVICVALLSRLCWTFWMRH